MFKTNCAYADADCTTRMRRRAGREIALRRMAEDIGKRKKSESRPRRRWKEGDLRSTRAHRRANRRRITDFDIVNGLLISDSDSHAGIILCIQRALGIFTREGRSLLVSISARLLRLLVLKNLIWKRKHAFPQSTLHDRTALLPFSTIHPHQRCSSPRFRSSTARVPFPLKRSSSARGCVYRR